MECTLSKALKEKNRIAARMERKLVLVSQDNTHLIGDSRCCDVRAAYEEAMVLFDQLLTLKKAIASANAGIAPLMVELDETKSLIKNIKLLDPIHGYRSELEKPNMETVISPDEREKKIESLQERINQLQDQIDEYNALTKIEIPERD